MCAVSFAFTVATSQAAPAIGATYYVDNQSGSCSNSGAGTEAQPYCTISAAVAARKGPDVTIIVKPGIYREQVTIPASGAEGLPYVIRAQGPGVLVDGSDSFANTGLWASSSGTVWLGSSVSWSPLQVYVDGARLMPVAIAPDSLPVNAFTWVSGQGLYVNLGGDNPGGRQTLVGRRSHGFSVFSKSWVTIDGFEVARTESRSIYLQSGCTDFVVSRNRVSFSNSYGIQTVGGLRIVIDQNVISDGNFHGIGLTAGATSCTVRDNESFRNADPVVRRANGIYLFGAPDNTLFGNRLHDNQDSGLFFTGGSNGCISYNNQSWNNGDHGFDHVGATGTFHTNDVAFGNYKDGFSIEGNSPNTQLYNCIAVDNGLSTDEFDLWVDSQSSVGLVSDYNIFWNSTTQELIRIGSTKYTTLAAYQAASGQDAHSAQADPRFVNGAAGDFHLMAGSPAIDAGTSALANWPTTDALGDARVDDVATPDRGTGPVSYSEIGPLEFLQQSEPETVELPNPLGTMGDRTVWRPPIAPLAAAEGTPVTAFSLSNGFPNPSRGAVEFALDLPQDSRVRWEVFDLQGRMVWSEERAFAAGRSRMRWDGRSASGDPAGTGVYLVRAEVGEKRFTRRVVRF